VGTAMRPSSFPPTADTILIPKFEKARLHECSQIRSVQSNTTPPAPRSLPIDYDSSARC
jgi:hypothetical protein